jgi:hypothetical protein
MNQVLKLLVLLPTILFVVVAFILLLASRRLPQEG